MGTNRWPLLFISFWAAQLVVRQAFSLVLVCLLRLRGLGFRV